jgi:sugar phosphate isomerase/epimerase
MSISWGKMVETMASLTSAAGFSHVQLAGDAVINLSPENFTRLQEQLQQHQIIPTVCSLPLPADVQVTELGFNIYVWTEYLKKAIRRLSSLGCRKLLWNNGRARVLPWEGDIAGFKEQVLQFLFMLCDIADEHHMTILVEPLGPMRTNFLNTMGEVSDFLDRVGKENLSSALSFRELGEIGLKIDKLNNYAPLIDHVQLENPQMQVGKRVPPKPEDGVDYTIFLQKLHDLNYEGMICLPADADDSTLLYCRKLWDCLSE